MIWKRINHPTRVSVFPWLLLVATLILAVMLAVNTWTNLQREKEYMIFALEREGMALASAFEAGARSALIRRSNMELESLVQEAFEQGLMAYVVIADSQNTIMASAGNWEGNLASMNLNHILQSPEPVSRFSVDSEDSRVLEVGARFDPLRYRRLGHGLRPSPKNRFGLRRNLIPKDLVIVIGLQTRPFDKQRSQLLWMSAARGGGLLLLGSAALVILFLTQRNRVQSATLQTMELYTENVISSMPGGLLALDPDGRVVKANRQARDLFALTGEVEGKTLSEVMGDEGVRLLERLNGGETLLEEPIDTVDDQDRRLPLKISASSLEGADGVRLGSVLVLRDLRDLRAMEEQLERSRRHAALGQMAAGIAHEIRNPLGTLRGFAEYFSDLRELDAGAGEYADLMMDEVDRLNRNVSALLQYARPREPERQNLPLEPLLEKCLRLVETEAEDHSVSLALSIDQELDRVQLDPDLITQVILNLVQNAFNACTPGDQVSLEAEMENDRLILTVADTGQGMTSEVRQKMFDPFFTTRKTGTGLGLAVVHQIVDAHGGTIEVDSAPGEGTEIRMFFPMSGGSYDA